MPRIRTIKPEFPQSETVGSLSRDSRLLFIQLWTIVDDEGRTRASSRMLASLLYPYDDDAPGLIDSWLDDLEKHGCIRRYEVDGKRYLDIPHWHEHQKIDHKSTSKLPACDLSREVSRGLAKGSDTLAPDLGPRIGPRTKSSEPNGSDAKASPIYTDSTHELWGEGIPILRNLGVSERDARSNVGRWLRDTKNDAQRVLGAIQRARDARAIEPIAWITRGLQTNGNGQNHAGNRANQTIDEAGAELFAEAAARQCRGASSPELPAPLRIASNQGGK